ncbi:Phage related integrase [Tritonibacter mobilis]|nr:Phage related integrase [Tritonibacter mobilis]
MEGAMKLELPGLLRERLPSGGFRYRVRVEGNKRQRIRLNVDLNHPEFMEHYRAARRGIQLTPESPAEDRAIRGSIDWLVIKHLADLEKRVKAEQASPLTLKKRTGLMAKFRAEYGEYSLDMPATKVVELRDSMMDTPAAADSMVEAIRSLYRWGCEAGLCDINPAIGVAKIDKGKGGATPWTADDLRKFREHHKAGTTPHLALTLFMFTACRIGDAIRLGRCHEFQRDGIRGLAWQPAKRGSAKVEIPMLPPLYRATRAGAVIGDTYLLNNKGKPFSSPDSLGQMFRRWCGEAGLKGRSSHGIRKAAGHLLAQEGCSQYQIMSIHGHTQAQTSEIYTKGVERWRMASDAMKRLEGMDW